MPGQGIVVVDFGAQGASDAEVAVTGQAGIVGSSLVEAWIFPQATATHSPDEHILETLKVFAYEISPGVGFRIRVVNSSQLNEPLTRVGVSKFRTSFGSSYGDSGASGGGVGTLIRGEFTVAWVWN